MTFLQELNSYRVPKAKPTSPPPAVGSKAPSLDGLRMPSPDKRPTIVTFLRHCGCPFAEKTFRLLSAKAAATPGIRFVAVSHSDQAATDGWLTAIGGADSQVQVVVDAERELFAAWGLGLSSLGDWLSPRTLSAVYRLGKSEGIWNRPTESGSRWQKAGSFGVDGEGIVKWGVVSKGADEIGDFEEAVRALDAASARL
ncbi:hypothetical protein FB45DRAFT_921739 [Roridomyces roridus]|uniref:Thioredoxin domain-containing protein n=1 Tax=Roridomyces roridus TaxID=1738132 RepID=A0AAD7BMP2_9AGAR|nr:hypothetical protein FB45DRAFT_921739 [Roridomyces roridus]